MCVCVTCLCVRVCGVVFETRYIVIVHHDLPSLQKCVMTILILKWIEIRMSRIAGMSSFKTCVHIPYQNKITQYDDFEIDSTLPACCRNEQAE